MFVAQNETPGPVGDSEPASSQVSKILPYDVLCVRWNADTYPPTLRLHLHAAILHLRSMWTNQWTSARIGQALSDHAPSVLRILPS
jgi:hypothetical protein